MPTLTEVREKRSEVLAAATRCGVTNVRVFGSVARGTATASSDIDLLVDVEPGTSLFELGELYLDLQEMLGTRVDLVTDSGLSPRLRDGILAEAVSL